MKKDDSAKVTPRMGDDGSLEILCRRCERVVERYDPKDITSMPRLTRDITSARLYHCPHCDGKAN